jgi:hypothetical protein
VADWRDQRSSRHHRERIEGDDRPARRQPMDPGDARTGACRSLSLSPLRHVAQVRTAPAPPSAGPPHSPLASEARHAWDGIMSLDHWMSARYARNPLDCAGLPATARLMAHWVARADSAFRIFAPRIPSPRRFLHPGAGAASPSAKSRVCPCLGPNFYPKFYYAKRKFSLHQNGGTCMEY